MASKTVDSANGEISTGVVTLTANAPDDITFTNDLDVVEIQSDGTADLFVRVDGGVPAGTGKFSRRLPAGSASVLVVPVPGTNKVIGVISSSATKYSVTKVS